KVGMCANRINPTNILSFGFHAKQLHGFWVCAVVADHEIKPETRTVKAATPLAEVDVLAGLRLIVRNQLPLQLDQSQLAGVLVCFAWVIIQKHPSDSLLLET